MKLDPAIEAVARALFESENDPILWCDHTDQTRDYYRTSARIAAKMIRAQVLEEAAEVVDDCAAMLRALKEQP